MSARVDLPTPGLRLVPMADPLSAALQPVAEVVERLVPRGVVTLLGGHGGAGKSALALALAAHVACGRDWAGLRVQQGIAVYVSLEDPAELVQWRLSRIIRTYDLDPVDLEARFRLYDGTAGDNPLAVEHVSAGVRCMRDAPAMDDLAQAACISKLIVVDNATDAFAADENNRQLVRSFLRRLSLLARAADAGLLLLAHIDKAGARSGTAGQSYSGSTAWHNSVRSRLALVMDPSGSLELRQEKANLSERAPPIQLTWNGPALLPLSSDLKQATRDQQLAADAESISAVIRVALQAGTTMPASLSGPASAAHALESLPELRDEFRGRDGRGRIRAAITQLLRDGRVAKEEYRKPNRHPGERIVLAHGCAAMPHEKCAASIPPTPPGRTGALGECAPVASCVTHAPPAQTGALTHCPKCDGEGCDWCRARAEGETRGDG